MELTNLIFPAPLSSYTCLDPDLVWIPVKQARSLLARVLQKETGQEYIPAFYIPYVDNIGKQAGSDELLVYFHANGEDLGISYESLMNWHTHLKVNVLGIEYPGYGVSVNRKTGHNTVLQDAKSVLQYVISHLGFSPNKITVVGRSIGTGPASYVATLYPQLKSLILISPFTSIKAVAKSLFGSNLPAFMKDQFHNLKHIKNLKCPLFIVHGHMDNLIPIEQSQKLLSYSSSKITGFIFPPQMTHNRFNLFIDVIKPYQQFCKNNQIEQSQLGRIINFQEKLYNYGLVEDSKLYNFNSRSCVTESNTEINESIFVEEVSVKEFIIQKDQQE